MAQKGMVFLLYATRGQAHRQLRKRFAPYLGLDLRAMLARDKSHLFWRHPGADTVVVGHFMSLQSTSIVVT